ncbi:hypothetical protein ACFFKE_32185 [Streptomyces mutabilis]|uniref:hypothetical protein n=1 Tax=Streptomyces mutabilis TaxID=67332 RepID=UPI00177CC0F3|nr:hypothetical protein [Streptomyces mutabilis]GGQ38307.1 hypothetical protein GCM10010279_54450 [Streptomyces mutabilis]
MTTRAAIAAEVLTDLTAKLESRLAVTTHKTVSKNTVLRFLRLEASAAREAAKTEATPAAAPSPAFAADTARRAHLLADMAKDDSHWKSGRVARWYEANSYPGLGVRAARHDLAVLRDSGAITQHDEKGVRFFTASRPSTRTEVTSR